MSCATPRQAHGENPELCVTGFQDIEQHICSTGLSHKVPLSITPALARQSQTMPLIFLPTREQVRDAAYRCQVSANNHLTMASLDNVLDCTFKGVGVLGSLVFGGVVSSVLTTDPKASLAALEVMRNTLFGDHWLGSVAVTVSVLSFGVAWKLAWGEASQQHLRAGKRYNIVARRARLLMENLPDDWEKEDFGDVESAVLQEWQAICKERDDAELDITVNSGGGCIHEDAKYRARQHYKELRKKGEGEPTYPDFSWGQSLLLKAVFWFS